MRYKCDKKFPFMHIKLALKSHFNLMDSFWEIPKKVENGCNFEGGRLTDKTKPFPSLNTWIYCLNTIFFMVHLALPLFFSILSSSSIFSKVAFFKNHRPKHLKLQNLASDSLHKIFCVWQVLFPQRNPDCIASFLLFSITDIWFPCFECLHERRIQLF